MFKINVRILGRVPGSIVREGDKDFEVFKSWAESRDRKSGMLICEACEETEELEEAPSEELSGEEVKKVEKAEAKGSTKKR